MKSQRKILKTIFNDEDRQYFEALLELDRDPNILEIFFIMLAQRKLTKFFKNNEKKFFSLSKKLVYDPTNLLKQFNDANVHNDHLYFSLWKAFSQEEEGSFLMYLKNKLK